LSHVPFELDAEALFEQAPCGYLTLDPDGTITRANGTFLQMTGHEAGSLVGRRFAALLTRGGQVYHETHFAPLLALQGTVSEIALELVREDGTRLPALVNATLVRDPAGAPRAIRVTILDASQRRGYERELLRMRDLERAERERTERLQRVSAALVPALAPAEIGEAVLEVLAPLAGSSRSALVLIDEGTGTRELAAWRGPARPEAGHALEDGTVRHCRIEGRSVAAITIGRPEPELSEPDRAFLTAVSEQCALALERARLLAQTEAEAARQRDVARALQESLLADPPPDDPRLAVATFYGPAVRGLQVGGDWHDAFAIRPGLVAVVVGDIVGRGLAAASAMGRLRSAVRALAVAGYGPAALFEQLDAFAAIDRATRMATAVYVELELETRRVRMASAGHPPALLIEPGAAPRYLWEGRSAPLGTYLEPASRRQTAFGLPAGAQMILYTDGLVERRASPLDVGFERLAQAASVHRERPLAELIPALVRTLAEDEAGEDDVCLLGVALPAPDAS
jgi:PAS domain S-box-containing protein